MMRKTIFTIEGVASAYIGYTSGKLWNGWATPHFEIKEALEVMRDFNKNAEYLMEYNAGRDEFFVYDEGNEDFDRWKGESIQTNEGVKHLYGIGAYSWIWDEAIDIDDNHLALEIEDFIFEYDTYHYRDECLDRMQTVEAIQNQLKELTVLKEVYEVWYNEDLTDDEKFEALGGVLTICEW